MEMSNPFEIEKRGTAFLIRFDRPEIRNPLSIEVLEKLMHTLLDIDKSDAALALVFSGQGNVFASGADLREIAAQTRQTAADFALRGQNVMNRIAGMRQTTIAAINGYCIGGALDLALACDIRVASPNASFAHPGADRGIITGWGGTQRLPRLIGEGRALEMFFETKQISAKLALDWGLVDRIEDDALADALESFK
jgi:enoyl-CoA hydratase